MPEPHPSIAAIRQLHERQRELVRATPPEGDVPPVAETTRTLAQQCAAHPSCTVISHYELFGNEWRHAWDSHAAAQLHIACRIGELTPECEDHLAGEGDRLLESPPIVAWEPKCIACHALLGDETPVHHVDRPSRIGRETHAHIDHPDSGMLADPEIAAALGVRLHTGQHYSECDHCAAIAHACDGCRAALDATAANGVPSAP